MGQKRTLKISLRETSTGLPIAEPFILQQRVAATLDERVVELEGKLRLLQSRLNDILTRSADEGARNAAALFETVGSFFLRLSADAEAGPPRRTALELGSLIETISATHETLTLPTPRDPRATICVEAGGPIDTLHRCILALNRTGVCAQAEIVVLDTGEHEDVALLPTIVRNLRYIRVRDDILVERNRIAEQARTELVVFLAGQSVVAERWFTEIDETFRMHPRAGVVGGKIVREDGVLEHAAVLLDGFGRLHDLGAGRIDGDPTCNFTRAVDAVGDYGIAFRRSAFVQAGGFDPVLIEPATATVDLCFRLGQANWSALFQPLASMLWRDGGSERSRWVLEDLNARTGAIELLRDRWASKITALSTLKNDNPFFQGRALYAGGQTVMSSNELLADLEVMKSLKEIDYEVTYGRVLDGHRDSTDVELLARQGIKSLYRPFYNSIEEYLRKHGEDLSLVYIPERSANVDDVDHLKALASEAQIVVGRRDLTEIVGKIKRTAGKEWTARATATTEPPTPPPVPANR
jgi:hypothetical protein